MKIQLNRTLLAALLGVAFAAELHAQSNAFTYQGRLNNDGAAYSGPAEFRFTLWDAAENGVELATTTPETLAATVSDGLFTLMLDFGNGPFINGKDRWLEIAVRTGLGEFQVLTPRQEMAPTPYAIHAREAASANAVTWNDVTDVPEGLADGTDADTTYTAGAGLDLDGTTFAISTGGVGTSQMAAGAVTTTKLADNAVSMAKLAEGAVTGPKLADGALMAGANVTIQRQGDGSLEIAATDSGLTAVTSDATLTGDGTAGSPLGLAAGAVSTAGIQDSAVTQLKLATDAVTTEKIVNNAVNSIKVADGSLVAADLADDVVQAGANVTVTRTGSGAFVVSSSDGGLTSVASNSTLSGDGTSGAPLGLSDGAVSGPKLADGTLVAGQNVALSRQPNGSVEIASSGLTLPYSGSTSSNSPVLALANNGAGNTLQINQAGADGIHILNAGRDGIRINAANNYGIFATGNQKAGYFKGDVEITEKIQIIKGIEVSNASLDGIEINDADRIGLNIGSTSSNGIQVGNAGIDGIQIQNAGRDGIRVSNAGSLAGRFIGDVSVSGTLTKGGGSFKIDHPLDPANKYLQHSFVESPDMMNVYNGNVVLDTAGEAVVELPSYFEALNRDFRYQLTAIGAPGPNLYVAEEIQDNRFKIAGGSPGMKVSWQVTGIRQDAWANEHRIAVEEDKPTAERGFYLHPGIYGQPQTRGVEWAPVPLRELPDESQALN